MRKCYVIVICDEDNNHLFVATASEVLDYLDKYQNQPGKNQDFPHASDKMVYYEKFESAEEAEQRKYQIILAEDKEKRRLINKFNPRWEHLVVRFTQEEISNAQN